MRRVNAVAQRGRFLLLFTVLLLASSLACNVNITLGDLPEPPAVGSNWYEIYFTNPTCPPESERVGGVDEIIADEVIQATRQVDVAAFDLDAEPLVEALIELEAQGVTVRIVTDSDNEDLSSIRRLRRNGISVVTDDRSALMHNKFIVIDDVVVWTGSLNYTTNGAYCNNNNAVRIVSPQLAANYTAEMDEMYERRSFGPRSPYNTPHERQRINGVLVESYFAPEREVAPIIARLIEQSRNEILFMAFSFTHEAIGEAMLERAEDGVTVRGVFETVGSETPFSYYPVFRDAGLPTISVRQDGNPRIMHHKVIVIDGEIVIFGSYNFSASANDSNDENVLVVHDPAFAAFFVEEFGFVWGEARP